MHIRNDIKWRHYKATLTSAELMIRLTDLAEFVRFAQDHHVQSIYCFENNGRVDRFGMSHKGGLFIAQAEGFKLLTDYREAMNRGFADAASYYEAVEKGFQNYEAYELSKGSELDDPETYRKLVDAHYKEGFEDYSRMLAEGRLTGLLPDMKNAYQLYQKGEDAGFANWCEMLAALEKGFTDGLAYRNAIQQKYTSAADYREGQEGGFAHFPELQMARTEGCASRKEFLGKLDLDSMDANGLKHDARVLLKLMSRLPENATVSVDKLQKLLESEMELYQDPQTRSFRTWFTLQLRDRNELLEFLRKDTQIKKFGSYDHERLVFVSHAINQRHVVIDGSNVAHNSHGDKKSVPMVSNLQRMVQRLQSLGFTDILVIVDASLKHKIDDRTALEAFSNSVKYSESPPNTSADLDIIAHVKRHNCLVITNDLFREWKLVDPWIEDNIDYYRLTFDILENKILLPEFDEKAN